jgi:hypothetical protein
MKVSSTAILTAVGKKLGEERRERLALEARVNELTDELRKIRADLDAKPRLRAMPPAEIA